MSNAQEAAKKNRRLRHLLLNRQFQLKYTAMILGVASAISMVLGWFLFQKLRENSRMLQLDPGFDEAFQAQLAASDTNIVLVLIGAFALFLVVLAVLSVVITHRMAGPIYVMRRYIGEIGAGALPRVRNLRKGDEFRDLFETLVETVGALEARAKEEIAVLEKLSGALAAARPPEGETLKAELDALLARKRRMLER
ncbi:MAG: hypothetical protein U1E65_18455 [Myxococcota bacterium]